VKKFLDLLEVIPEPQGAEYHSKLLALIEKLQGVGLAFFDDMLICRYADEGFAELAETSAEKLLGVHMQTLMPGASVDKFTNLSTQKRVSIFSAKPLTLTFVSAVKGQSLLAEASPAWKDGEFFGVLAAVYPAMPGEQAQFPRLREMPLLKLIHEIDSEPRMQKLIGPSAGPRIIVLNGEGRLEFISRTARALFGLPEEEQVDYVISSDTNFSSPDTASLVNDALMGMEVHFPPVTYSTDLPGALGHGSGRTATLHFSFRQFEDTSSSTYIAMVIYVPQQAEFSQTVAFMQRSESVAMLARGVAHEFNNIFAAIKGITSLLHSEIEEGGFADNYLSKMDGLVERGVKLIADLTSYARMSEPRMEKVSVEEFFSNFTSMVDFVVPKDVKLTAPVQAKGYLECDRNLLRQALFNLVQNALDALHDTRDKRISILAEAREAGASGLPPGLFRFSTPDVLVVSIADSGPGIPAELAGSIFEPYFSTKDPQRSTGLGLNVSSQIFRRHGGVLFAERQGPLGGAEFRIYLPLHMQP
jgi:signal transduction histidine kinase